MASKSVSDRHQLVLRGWLTTLKLLGRYSLVSLQGLDGGSLVAVVILNNLGALLKASKVQALVQLDCKLVDLKFVNLGLWKDHLQVEGDDLSEGLAFWASEGEV